MDFSEFLQFVPRVSQADSKDYTVERDKILPYRKELFARYPNMHYRPAAVLALFYPHNDRTYAVLIERPRYDGVHSGQIAFPGGKKDSSDKDLYATALREAREEIGIEPAKVRLIRPLTPVKIPVSRFEVSPFWAYTEKRPRFRPHPAEVKNLLEIPAEDLFFAPWRRENRIYEGKTYPVFYLPAGSRKIWGATAMVIAEMRDLLHRFLPGHTAETIL